MKIEITTEDREEARRLVKSDDLCAALWDAQHEIIGYYYKNGAHGKSAEQLINELHAKWYANIELHGINFSDIWT